MNIDLVYTMFYYEKLDNKIEKLKTYVETIL